MRFGVGQVISICGYGVIFLVSAIANLMVLKILIARYRKTKSRVNLLLCHLAIADLLVSRQILFVLFYKQLYDKEISKKIGF